MNIFVIYIKMNKSSIIRNLKHLWLTDNEIKVYISLTELWESSLLNISKKAWLPRTTVKSIIDRLIDNWYISVHKYNNINNYWIESLDTLKENFKTKINLVDDLSHHLDDLYRSSSDLPFSQVYDTTDSIRTFIEKTIASMDDNSDIFTIDSPEHKNYNMFFSKEYFENLLLIKKKKKIITNTLIPYSSFKYISENALDKQDIIIKEMDKKINFESSLWIIDDRLILFSSQITFIVEVKNYIIVNSIKSLLKFVWEISDEVYNNN